MTQQLAENPIYDQSFANQIKSYQPAIREKGLGDIGGNFEALNALYTCFAV